MQNFVKQTPLKVVGLFLVLLKEGQESKLNPIRCLGNTC